MHMKAWGNIPLRRSLFLCLPSYVEWRPLVVTKEYYREHKHARISTNLVPNRVLKKKIEGKLQNCMPSFAQRPQPVSETLNSKVAKFMILPSRNGTYNRPCRSTFKILRLRKDWIQWSFGWSNLNKTSWYFSEYDVYLFLLEQNRSTPILFIKLNRNIVIVCLKYLATLLILAFCFVERLVGGCLAVGMNRYIRPLLSIALSTD